MICNRDEVIAMAGESKKDYLNKNISSQIGDIISDRTQVFETEVTHFEVIQGEEEEVESFCIHPIIANWDPISCVMMFSKDGEKLTEIEQKAIEKTNIFLAKQME